MAEAPFSGTVIKTSFDVPGESRCTLAGSTAATSHPLSPLLGATGMRGLRGKTLDCGVVKCIFLFNFVRYHQDEEKVGIAADKCLPLDKYERKQDRCHWHTTTRPRCIVSRTRNC